LARLYKSQLRQQAQSWLASGDWWNEMRYDRREWDVEVQFTDGTKGRYRIFLNLFTNQSFVDGSYD
jgi:hypothetical protein